MFKFYGFSRSKDAFTFFNESLKAVVYNVKNEDKLFEKSFLRPVQIFLKTNAYEAFKICSHYDKELSNI